MSELHYRRILLKLSGEALMGDGRSNIDPNILQRLAAEVVDLSRAGLEVALVIGGGNLIRGADQASANLKRVTGDHMGMLATVMNALALQDAIEHLGVPVRVLSALHIRQICEDYSPRQAVRDLKAGRVVIFAAGTGNPFFTTDSAASLRAIEIGADLLIKATKVDGVYSADPKKDPNAIFYAQLTYDQALTEKLAVMDATALVLCRDHCMPLRVMNAFTAGAILRLVQGEDIGSLITN